MEFLQRFLRGLGGDTDKKDEFPGRASGCSEQEREEKRRMVNLLQAMYMEGEVAGQSTGNARSQGAKCFEDYNGKGNDGTFALSLTTLEACAKELPHLCELHPAPGVWLRAKRIPEADRPRAASEAPRRGKGGRRGKAAGAGRAGSAVWDDSRLEVYDGIYESLYQARSKMMAPKSRLSLLWGLGLLQWKVRSGPTYQHPLVLLPIELFLLTDGDASIEIRPVPPEREGPHLFLQPLQQADAHAVLEFRDLASKFLLQERAVGDYVLDQKARRDMLQALATTLNSRCTVADAPEVDSDVLDPAFQRSHTKMPAAEQPPVIMDAAVIICRQEAATTSTAKACRMDLVRTMKALSRCSAPLPPAAAYFVRRPHEEEGREWSERREAAIRAQETAPIQALPLVSSPEQLAVIDALDHTPAVLVVGPPGSGKTHCIANVCAAAALRGWRVLVYSERPPALEVLYEKLPQGLKDFAVNLRLAGEWEHSQEVQKKLQDILKINAASKNALSEKMQYDANMRKLEGCKQRLKSIDERLERLIKAGSTQTDVPRDLWDALCGGAECPEEMTGKAPSTALLAQLAGEGFKRTPQLFDEVLLWPPPQQPAAAVLEEVRDLRRKLSPAWPYSKLPDATSLPSYKDMLELRSKVHELQQMSQRASTVIASKALEDTVRHTALASVPWRFDNRQDFSVVHDRVRILCAFASNWLRLVEEGPLDGSASSWSKTGKTIVNCLSALSDSNLAKLEDKALQLAASSKQTAATHVDLPEGDEACMALLGRAARALATGGYAKHLGVFGKLNARALFSADARQQRDKLNADLAAVKVAGQKLSLKERTGWLQVAAAAEDRVAFEAFWKIWSKSVGRGRAARMELHTMLQSRSWLEDCLVPAVKDMRRLRMRLLEKQGSAQRFAARQAAASTFSPKTPGEALEIVGELLKGVSEPSGAGPIPDCVQHLLAMAFGEEDIQPAIWNKHLEELRRLNESAALQAHPQRGMPRLRHLVQNLPTGWARRILQGSSDHSGQLLSEEEVLPSDWKYAWALKCAQALALGGDVAPALNQGLRDRRAADAALRDAADKVLTEVVPVNIRRNLKKQHVSAIVNVSDALKTLSQSSKNTARAEQARQLLKKELPACCEAFPLLLTTLGDAATMELPATPGLFDLVILDEGSQSEPSAISALLRGKRCLIVGDPDQVSPLDSVRGRRSSEEHAAVVDLLMQDQPLADKLLPGSSIFDAARTAFVAEQAQHMLREHFRCVPELIAWCSERFYPGHLLPMRVPRSEERMDPPLVDCLVAGRKEQKANPEEAKAVVEQVQKYVHSDVCRSLGVIALSPEQVDLLIKKLRIAFQPDVWKRHSLRVGTPKDFQGDERSIIILSMVEDDNSASTPHSGKEYCQKYNVAMSRARDRMVIVRSCGPEEIMRKRKQGPALDNELKLSIINHLLQSSGRQGWGLAGCGLKAVQLGDGASRLLRGLQLVGIQASSGFWPRVGAKIDIVAEDPKSSRRAAFVIEADNADSHTIQASNSVASQLAMERVGWCFLRMSAAACLLQPQKAVEAALAFLEEDCDIRPRREVAKRYKAEYAKAAAQLRPPPRSHSPEDETDDEATAEPEPQAPSRQQPPPHNESLRSHAATSEPPAKRQRTASVIPRDMEGDDQLPHASERSDLHEGDAEPCRAASVSSQRLLREGRVYSPPASEPASKRQRATTPTAMPTNTGGGLLLGNRGVHHHPNARDRPGLQQQRSTEPPRHAAPPAAPQNLKEKVRSASSSLAPPNVQASQTRADAPAGGAAQPASAPLRHSSATATAPSARATTVPNSNATTTSATAPLAAAASNDRTSSLPGSSTSTVPMPSDDSVARQAPTGAAASSSSGGLADRLLRRRLARDDEPPAQVAPPDASQAPSLSALGSLSGPPMASGSGQQRSHRDTATKDASTHPLQQLGDTATIVDSDDEPLLAAAQRREAERTPSRPANVDLPLSSTGMDALPPAAKRGRTDDFAGQVERALDALRDETRSAEPAASSLALAVVDDGTLCLPDLDDDSVPDIPPAERRSMASAEAERILQAPALRPVDGGQPILRGASFEERKRDFRHLVRLVHPDHGYVQSGEAFRRLHEAYRHAARLNGACSSSTDEPAAPRLNAASTRRALG
eukprot:TRINITY_DN19005_c1_g3_i1.p1 TRINITY_DN19005_c1_g3~~TRINITY_DN19005_c1_g3_i1.p1  ORF type:complete len:2137 (+),score=466.98 TRINITY_DN19005_c1_g3_i1:148-6558(+)